MFQIIPEPPEASFETPLKRLLRMRAPERHEKPQSFSTWLYSSSTGVARPKIDTATLRRARA